MARTTDSTGCCRMPLIDRGVPQVPDPASLRHDLRCLAVKSVAVIAHPTALRVRIPPRTMQNAQKLQNADYATIKHNRDVIAAGNYRHGS